MARQQQAPAPSTFGQRVGTALRQPLTSPTGMGLATAALTGLEMAGPQQGADLDRADIGASRHGWVAGVRESDRG